MFKVFQVSTEIFEKNLNFESIKSLSLSLLSHFCLPPLFCAGRAAAASLAPPSPARTLSPPPGSPKPVPNPLGLATRRRSRARTPRNAVEPPRRRRDDPSDCASTSSHLGIAQTPLPASDARTSFSLFPSLRPEEPQAEPPVPEADRRLPLPPSWSAHRGAPFSTLPRAQMTP